MQDQNSPYNFDPQTNSYQGSTGVTTNTLAAPTAPPVAQQPINPVTPVITPVPPVAVPLEVPVVEATTPVGIPVQPYASSPAPQPETVAAPETLPAQSSFQETATPVVAPAPTPEVSPVDSLEGPAAAQVATSAQPFAPTYDDSSLESSTTQVVGSPYNVPATTSDYRPTSKHGKPAIILGIISLILLLLLAIGGGILYFRATRQAAQFGESGFNSGQTFKINDITLGGEDDDQTHTVTVNGDLRVIGNAQFMQNLSVEGIITQGGNAVCDDSNNCGTVTGVNNISGEVTIQGTPDQITVANNGQIISLSLPQSIAPTSSPTFAGLTITASRIVQEGNTVCDNSNNCGYVPLSVGFVQGGNSFGTTASLGTNDNQALNFETNNIARLTVEADGDVNVDSSTLFVDSANNRVGIGTTAPGTKLQVVGGSVVIDATQIYGIGGTDRGLYGDTTLGLGLRTGSTDRLVVSETGNVGVGDVTPAELFTVGNGDPFRVNAAGAIVAATGISSSGTITFSSLPAGALYATAGGVLNSETNLSVSRGGTGAGSFTQYGVVYGNGTGALQVTAAGASGQCLVGNTGAAPTWNVCASTLQVAYDNSTNPEIVLNSTNGALTVRDALVAIGANLFEVQNNAGTTTYFGVDSSGAQVGGVLEVSTLGVGDNDNLLCLNSSNQLANCNTAGSAFIQGGNSFGGPAFLGTNDTFDLNIETSGLTRLTVEADGDVAFDTNTLFVDAANNRVGIGTTAPNALLNLSSDISAKIHLDGYSTGGSTASPGLVFNRANGTSAAPLQVGTNDRLGIIEFRGYNSSAAFSNTAAAITGYAAEPFTSSATGAYLRFETTPIGSTTRAERVRITDAGNVGIGVTDPNTILDLQGGFTIRSATAPSAAPTDQGRFYYDATSDTVKLSLNGGSYNDLCTTIGNCAGAGGGITGSGVAGQAAFFTGTGTIAGDNGFFWDNTNKQLGIGDSTPTEAKLVVDASSASTVGQVIRSAASPTANLLEFKNSLGTTLSSFGPTGNLSINNGLSVASIGGSYTISFGTAANASYNTLMASSAPGRVVLGIRGTASQAGDLIQLQDSSGNVNAAFNALGNQLTLGLIASGGTVTQGKLVFADGTTSNFGVTLQSNTLTANRTYNLPNSSATTDTVCLQTLGNCAGSGGGIVGSGVAGQAAFFTGTGTISGDNGFFWDNTNKRLGIGTTTPESRFHIIGDGTAGSAQALIERYTSTPNIILRRANGTSGSPTAVLSGDQLGALSFNGHDGTSFAVNSVSGIRSEATEAWTALAHGADLIFRTTANGATSGTDRLRIDSSGSVLIGTNTSTSSALLQTSQPALASTAEILADFRVADNATSRLRINKTTGTDRFFSPRIDSQ
jgi:hypothetical protein